MLELVLDVIENSCGDIVYEWLEFLSLTWTDICNHILHTEFSQILLGDHCDISSKSSISEHSDLQNGTMNCEKSSGDVNKLSKTSLPPGPVRGPCDWRSKRTEVTLLYCQLFNLWTEMVKQCYANFDIRSQKLTSLLQPLTSIFGLLSEQYIYSDLIVFKSAMKLLNCVFDYSQTFAVKSSIDELILRLANSVENWCIKTSFKCMPFSSEKGFGGEMTMHCSTKTEVQKKFCVGNIQTKAENPSDMDRNMTPAVSQLRSIASLVLKSIAVTAKFGRSHV